MSIRDHCGAYPGILVVRYVESKFDRFVRRASEGRPVPLYGDRRNVRGDLGSRGLPTGRNDYSPVAYRRFLIFPVG